MDESRIVELRQQAQHLDAIKQLPSWAPVKDIIEAHRHRRFRRLLSPDVITPQEMDYTRGYIAGLDYLVQIVENAENTLRKSIEEAEKLEKRKGLVNQLGT